jgi:hypothetical protein
MSGNLQDKEVRNIRLFLSKEISRISSMLAKKNLSSGKLTDADVRESLQKQKTELKNSRSKLIDSFQTKKLQVMSSQWKKVVSDLTDEKLVANLIAGDGIQILGIEELARKTTKKRNESDNKTKV